MMILKESDLKRLAEQAHCSLDPKKIPALIAKINPILMMLDELVSHSKDPVTLLPTPSMQKSKS